MGLFPNFICFDWFLKIILNVTFDRVVFHSETIGDIFEKESL
jgi:hypothetical protein